MAKKIAVALRKGGSGKTTTAINLATALVQLGKKVLLVDLDSQANATVAVGIDPTKLDKTINTLFTDSGTTTRDVIIHTDFGLDVLPSHPILYQTELKLAPTQVGALVPLFQEIDADYDYIIIDTPPNKGYLLIAALVACDEVLIPLQAHYLALYGLEEALLEIERTKQGLNPRLVITGILPVMVSEHTNIGRTIMDEIRNKYDPALILPMVIKFSVKHIEANLAGKPIVLYDPRHNGSLAYINLARKIVGLPLEVEDIPHEQSPEPDAGEVASGSSDTPAGGSSNTTDSPTSDQPTEETPVAAS